MREKETLLLNSEIIDFFTWRQPDWAEAMQRGRMAGISRRRASEGEGNAGVTYARPGASVPHRDLRFFAAHARRGPYR
jgi:hypothetical protein